MELGKYPYVYRRRASAIAVVIIGCILIVVAIVALVAAVVTADALYVVATVVVAIVAALSIYQGSGSLKGQREAPLEIGDNNERPQT